MAVAVLGVDVGVVIDKVFVPGIIRRVYIDNVDFSGVCVSERGKCFEVVAFYYYMVWIVNMLIIRLFTPPQLRLYQCLR